MRKLRMKIAILMAALCLTACFTMTALAKEKVRRGIASPSNAQHPDRSSPSEMMLLDGIEPFRDDGLFEFSIRKTGNSGTLKDSAIFRLYLTLENAYDDEDAMIFSVNLDDNTYYSCTAGDWPEGDMIDKDIYAGKAYIKGLDPGVYYLMEVAAPKGYQRLPYAFRIIIKEDGTVTWREEVTGGLETEADDGLITIENRAVVLMPGTGGPGDTVFYVVGLICIAGAVLAAFRLKKQR